MPLLLAFSPGVVALSLRILRTFSITLGGHVALVARMGVSGQRFFLIVERDAQRAAFKGRSERETHSSPSLE